MRFKPSRNRASHLAILALALAAFAGCEPTSTAVSGVVEAPRYNVSAERGGRIIEMLVSEGETVVADQVLLRLDCTAPQLLVDEADAALAAATAQLNLVMAGPRASEIEAAGAAVNAAQQQERLARHGATAEQIAQIDAAIEAVDARISYAESSVQRLTQLGGAGASTQAELDAGQIALDTARAERAGLTARRNEAVGGARREERAILASQTERAQAQLRGLEEGARTEEVAIAASAVNRAQVAIRTAEDAVEHCNVRAGRAGTVSIVDFEVGEVVGPGTPVFAIETLGAMEIRTYAPQAWLADLSVGTVLEVRVDGFADQPFPAEVMRIHDAAEFTPGNVQTPEDRMLLVYRMDLRVVGDAPLALRSGMSVSVEKPADSGSDS